MGVRQQYLGLYGFWLWFWWQQLTLGLGTGYAFAGSIKILAFALNPNEPLAKVQRRYARRSSAHERVANCVAFRGRWASD